VTVTLPSLICIESVVDGTERKLRIYRDYEPAVFYSYNKSSGCIKYIDVECYVAKEKIPNETIKIENIKTL
jgi:hypothetical protein